MSPEPSAAVWVGLFLFAGFAGLDDTSWPQAMVSRPLVAGSLGGWLAGAAGVGLAVGAVLELLLLPYRPLGGARSPDPGPASLVAGAAGAASGPAAGPVLAAALLGWALSWLGEVTVRWQRRLSSRLLGDAPERVREPRAVERWHLTGLATDFLRGALLGVVWWLPATLLVRVVAVGGPAPSAGVLAAAGTVGAAAVAVAGACSSRTSVRVAAPAVAVAVAAMVWWLA